jgi:coiled-coil and C2 domain-containing protein 2A
MFQNLPDTYTTCQEFLDLGAGDYEEHAILLANYFQYIDDLYHPNKFQNYLVFGEAIPEGMTVYVLRKLKDDKQGTSVELWQPLTGESYFLRQSQVTGSGFCGT